MLKIIRIHRERVYSYASMYIIRRYILRVGVNDV